MVIWKIPANKKSSTGFGLPIKDFNGGALMQFFCVESPNDFLNVLFFEFGFLRLILTESPYDFAFEIASVCFDLD